MKKRLSLIVKIASVILLLQLCMIPAFAAGTEEQAGSDPIHIVCTIFPEYDWVRSIVGDSEQTEVTLLLDQGVDLHSFQPTAQDIMKIAGCDVFIYVGGQSDAWVEDALKEAVNEEMIVIDLMDVLGDQVKEEKIVEGMEAEEEDGEEGPEYDEHIWLSLKDAATCVNAIAEALAAADEENADTYLANADTYTQEISALDASYQEAIANADKKTILFGDRFPFRYMADDYGLSYYAAFAGCEAETEASFETVIFLADKVDELQLDTILTIEGSDQKIAETINENTKDKNNQILTMNSMQGTTSNDVADGATYLSIMSDNLNVLKEALQ